MGRIAGGVRAINLEKDDEVVAMELVEPGQELMVVTKKGYGKRTKVEDYKIQVRGGKGLLIKPSLKRLANLLELWWFQTMTMFFLSIQMEL